MATKKKSSAPPAASVSDPENDAEAGAEAGAEATGKAGAKAGADFSQDLNPSCREKLLEIVKEAQEEGRVTKCTLNKPGVPGQKGQGKRLLGQWIDYIPEEHDVGLTHGSGFYFEKIYVPQKDGTTEIYFNKFTLDVIYDEYKRENDKTNYRPLAVQINPTGATGEPLPAVIPPPAAAPSLLSGSGQLTDLMLFVKEIATLFKPQESQMEQLGKFGEVMAVSMQKQLLSNIAFFKQLQAEVLPMLAQGKDEPNPDDEPDNGKDGAGVNGTATADPQESVLITMVKATLPKIMPQLASYALRLLDPDPAKSEAIIKMLNSYGISNIFQTPALSNDAKKIIAYLDTQLTPEKTTAALEKIGVNAGQYR